MKKTEMEITIGPDGEVKIEVIGVSGKTCVDATEFLEEALGEVKDREFTREYYQQGEEVTEKDQLRIGNE